jgi:predicted nucleic acid-binding protein
VTDFVVDASVAIKWFIPEVHSEHAIELLDRQKNGETNLHAPDLIFSETGNILWKKILKGELMENDATLICDEIRKVPKTIYNGKDLAKAALTLAIKTKRTVYDCMYLGLAVFLDCSLITADRRLYNSLAKSKFKKFLRWIEEYDQEVNI